MSGWLPIATAPKDRVILLFSYSGNPRWNSIHAGRWDKDKIGNGWGHQWVTASYQNLGVGIEGLPTHWMPLPEPPQ